MTTQLHAEPERYDRTGHHTTRRRRMLPKANSRWMWSRMLKATQSWLFNHLGGPDRVSEVQALIVRRASALEVELRYLEARFARQRHNGEEPLAADLSLYNALANGQRRLLDMLGLQRVPRDAVPTIEQYLSQIEKADEPSLNDAANTALEIEP